MTTVKQPVVSGINRNELVQAFEDFKALDGRKTSELNEYQKRLVEMFTTRQPGRKEYSGMWLRKSNNYIFPTLLYFGLGDGKSWSSACYNITLVEDVEIAFPEQPSDEYVYENALNSLHEDVYIPTTSRLGKTFRAIRYNSKTGELYTATNKDFQKSFKPFTMLSDLPSKTSQCNEAHLDTLYNKAELVGRTFVLEGNIIQIDNYLLPTFSSTHPLISTQLTGEILIWSKSPREAPEHIQAALAYLKANTDNNFPYSLTGHLGEYNSDGDYPNVTNRRGLSSQALAIATDVLYRTYGQI